MPHPILHSFNQKDRLEDRIYLFSKGYVHVALADNIGHMTHIEMKKLWTEHSHLIWAFAFPALIQSLLLICVTADVCLCYLCFSLRSRQSQLSSNTQQIECKLLCILDFERKQALWSDRQCAWGESHVVCILLPFRTSRAIGASALWECPTRLRGLGEFKKLQEL